ncbi:hypothetical protein QCA50_008759 [Cerrena zonata]|uniref:Uncharacterized protein n=1 Tax=Cerrena zonata TaxID=2478898 RepID=A0AAW0G4X5_9APHY
MSNSPQTINCVPFRPNAPRYPAITQIIHIVKPRKMQGPILLTSADPMHEIALTNWIAMPLHNCISFTTATIFYGQQVSDSVTDTDATTELSLRRAVLGAFLRMNSEARAIKARHHDIQRLIRYIFIWYTPHGGPVLPDTFAASTIPTWPEIDEILIKTAIHISVITPASDRGAMRFFSGLTHREVSPDAVRKAVPGLYPNFRVFQHVQKQNREKSDEAEDTPMSVDSPGLGSGEGFSFLEPLLLPSSESLSVPFEDSMEN